MLDPICVCISLIAPLTFCDAVSRDPIVKLPETSMAALTSTAPFTCNVPATNVLPLALSTVNLLVLTSKFPSTPAPPLTCKLAKVARELTCKVLASVVAKSTPSVPSI